MSQFLKQEAQTLCYVKQTHNAELDAQEALDIFLLNKSKFIRQLIILEDTVSKKKRGLDSKVIEQLTNMFTDYRRHLLSLKRVYSEQETLTKLCAEYKELKKRFIALGGKDTLESKNTHAQTTKLTT